MIEAVHNLEGLRLRVTRHGHRQPGRAAAVHLGSDICNEQLWQLKMFLMSSQLAEQF